VPQSVEAERQLIGAALYDNEALSLAPDTLKGEAFYEGLYGRIWDHMAREHAMGLATTIETVGERFRRDPAMKAIGGLAHLVDLVDHAPPVYTVERNAGFVLGLATRRRIIAYAESLAKAARDGEQDVEALVERAEGDLLQIDRVDAKAALVTAEDAADRVLAYVDDRSTPVGFLTGLAPLDAKLGPILPEDLIVIGGRSGMGKSALASHIALRISHPAFWLEGDDLAFGESLAGRANQEPAGVIEINAEMSVEQMMRRHMADIGHHLFGSAFPTYSAIRNKRVTDDQRRMMQRAREVFDGMPLRMIKRTGITMATIGSIARRQAQAWRREGIRVGAIIVDHAGLVRAEGRVSRYEGQTDTAMALKVLADDLKAPVIALVQLSRKVEDRDNKKPQVSDLKDSGAYEENADAILFPFRESYYADKEPEPNSDKDQLKYAEWIIRKNSKKLEIDVAKLREGAGGMATCWAEVAWNAIRGSEPRDKAALI
jgi:replicative DNA helicase